MLYADSQIRLPDHPVMITDRMIDGARSGGTQPLHGSLPGAVRRALAVDAQDSRRNLRYIQRKLAARYLPPEILARPKQGFSSALPYVLGNEYRILYARYLRDRDAGARGNP